MQTIHSSFSALVGSPRQIPARPQTLRFASDPQANAKDRAARIDVHLDQTELPAFQDAFRLVFQQARDYIFQQVALGKKGFVILDVDETALDNRGYFREPDFYKKAPGLVSIRDTWRAWVQRAQIPHHPTAKALIDEMNHQGVPYVFLTGIEQALQPYSERNLKSEGLWGPHCEGGYYRPAGTKGSTRDFKLGVRNALEQRLGMPVMASLGDRPGDMTGIPEHDFLLPSYVKALRAESDAS